MDRISTSSLFRLRALADKRLHHCRTEVVKNGAETFIKYGPEFCYKWSKLYQKLNNAINTRRSNYGDWSRDAHPRHQN